MIKQFIKLGNGSSIAAVLLVIHLTVTSLAAKMNERFFFSQI